MREALGGVTRREGFPTREELIARYEQRTGRSMRDLRWYTTLALWKSVVFMEGNYKRAVAGTTDDPYLKHVRRGRARAGAPGRGGGVMATEQGADARTLASRGATARRTRPADRLGRRADEQPVRLLPRLLRAGRDRPADAARALRLRSGVPRAADRAGEGRAGGGRVRAAARAAARGRARRPDRRPVRGRAARRGDGRGGAQSARGRAFARRSCRTRGACTATRTTCSTSCSTAS